MINLDFASEELVYKQCLKYDPEIRERISITLKSCGNRCTDDCVQDIYIKALKLFVGQNPMMQDFKKQLMELTEEICMEYYWAEKKNYAKPRKFISHSTENNNDELDSFLWEKVQDRKETAEHQMIIIEQIEALKEYKKQWLSFSHAKEYVAIFKFKSKSQWIEYCNSGKKLKNVPENPDEVYKKFTSWEDWLNIHYYSFDECINWVRNNLSAKSKEEWESLYSEFPSAVPKEPDEFYKETGWINWDHFLGYNKEQEFYLPYREAQKWVEKNLLLFNPTEELWEKYITTGIGNWPELPKNIPSDPEMIYNKTGWISWFRWFGRQNYQKRIWPITYHECARWVKNNLALISTQQQWDTFILENFPVVRPDYIPPNPHVIFRGIGWHGWNSFLNNNNKGFNYDCLFGTENVRILYNGEKIWVKPISMFRETITGKVVTLFCNPGKDAEITFLAKDIVGMNRMGGIKFKKNISNKYKISV